MGDRIETMRRAVKWIRTTIAEPFPVFYSHVSQKSRKQGEAEGPFYAAGGEDFTLYSAVNLRWKLDAAERIRKDGYTVTVDVVVKETNVYGPARVSAECFA